MRMKAPKKGSCDPVELPPSLHSFHRVSPSDQVNIASEIYLSLYHPFLLILSIVIFHFIQEGYQTFRGGFWNYFSLGKNFAL